MLKLSDNPPITSCSEQGLSVFSHSEEGDATSKWSAAYTKPRQEKALARELLKLGVPYFLPLVDKVSMSGGRRRHSLNPLFSSYLFFQDDEEHRISLLRTNRVVQIVSPSAPEQERFISEMQSLELALITYPEQVELHPRVIEGAQVRITAGAMKGTEGIVIHSENRSKIWLQVTLLGTGALVEIPADLLELL